MTAYGLARLAISQPVEPLLTSSLTGNRPAVGIVASHDKFIRKNTDNF